MRRTVALSILVASAISTITTLGILALVFPHAAGAQANALSAAALQLYGPDGTPRAFLGALDSADGGNFGAVFLDPGGNARVRLSTEADGRGTVQLTDGQGQVRANLQVGADGSPTFTMNDASGAQRMVTTVGPDGASHLGFFDAAGNLAGALPSN